MEQVFAHDASHVNGVFSFHANPPWVRSGGKWFVSIGITLLLTAIIIHVVKYGTPIDASVLDSELYLVIIAALGLIISIAGIPNLMRKEGLHLKGIRLKGDKLLVGRYLSKINKAEDWDLIFEHRRGLLTPGIWSGAAEYESKGTFFVLKIIQRTEKFFAIGGFDLYRDNSRIDYFTNEFYAGKIEFCVVIKGEYILFPRDKGESFNKSLIDQINLVGTMLSKAGFIDSGQCKLQFLPSESGSGKLGSTLMHGAIGYVVSEAIDGIKKYRLKKGGESGIIINDQFTQELAEQQEKFGWDVQLG